MGDHFRPKVALIVEKPWWDLLTNFLVGRRQQCYWYCSDGLVEHACIQALHREKVRSSGTTLVSVVQTANLRHSDHGSHRLHRTRIGRIPIQRLCFLKITSAFELLDLRLSGCYPFYRRA